MSLKTPLKFHLFLIPASIVTIIYFTILVAGMQIYRNIANDPQLQLSEDMANYLSSGGESSEVMPKSEVDIKNGQVWFLIIYNQNGEVVNSNARLDGQTPELPKGVLDNAKQRGQNIVTWEPEKGLRIATVVTPYKDGFVLAGRNLEKTEERIMRLAKLVLGAWVLSIAVGFFGFWFLVPNFKKS